MSATNTFANPLANPFNDPLRFERRVPECAIIIFGANGDLTKRKLLPALYRLAYERRLPASFAIVGNSRTPMSDDAFREKMHEAVKQFLEDSPFDEDLWTSFARNLYYVAGDLKDAHMYAGIGAKLAALGQENALFYLSTQPSYYAPIVDCLGAAKLADSKAGAWRRIVIEKPFGHDLASAIALNNSIHRVVPENEVYRIDHYLGKETVQNILAFRFGNGIFEPVWNRRYVNHVQITAAESIGVEGRGAYYQEAGALRDMIQNHLLQVTSTMAMEPSAAFEPNAVRDERAKLLRSVKIMHSDEVLVNAVSGQYRGFRQEQGVDPQSQTDTYAAVTFFIDNWRWAGVPFFLRTGKRLAEGRRIISIAFREPPKSMFPAGSGIGAQGPDHLTFDLADAAKMSLSFYGKRPGPGMRLDKLSMQFAMHDTGLVGDVLEAYERLILDVMRGDHTLFTTAEGIERLWEVSVPLLEAPPPVRLYAPSSWGPNSMHQLVAPHAWRLPFERAWRDPNSLGS